MLGGAGDTAERELTVQEERETCPRAVRLAGGSTGLWESTAGMQLTSLGKKPESCQ